MSNFIHREKGGESQRRWSRYQWQSQNVEQVEGLTGTGGGLTSNKGYLVATQIQGTKAHEPQGKQWAGEAVPRGAEVLPSLWPTRN